MAEPHWRKVDDTVLGLECDFHPRCFNCRTEVEDINCRFLNFAPDTSDPDNLMGHAIDVNVICQSCGWTTVFGVAIEKEHYEEVREVSKGIQQEIIREYFDPNADEKYEVIAKKVVDDAERKARDKKKSAN